MNPEIIDATTIEEFYGCILVELSAGLREENPTSASESLVRGRSGTYRVHCQAWLHPSWLGVWIPLELDVPADRRAAMAEAVAHANDGLGMGGFQFNVATGGIRFACGMPVFDGNVTPTQLGSMIMSATHLVDTYVPALRRVAATPCSPAEAIADVEVGAQED